MIGKDHTGGFKIPHVPLYPSIKGELRGMGTFHDVSDYEPEDRPAEMKKDRVDDPFAHAMAMVQVRHYPNLPIEQIYVVWFCSALQNWKALVSTNVKDNCYYEVTHDGTKNCTYVDQYIKVENTKIDLNKNTMSGTAYPDLRNF